MRELTPWVVRFGAMGDMVLLIPMLKVLRQRFGRPCELVSSGSWTTPLMERVPACGPIHLITSRRMPYWFNRSQWRLVSALRQRPPGPVYVFEVNEKSHELLQRGGVKPEWICSMRELPLQPGEHIVAHALRLARETPAALRGSLDFPMDESSAPDARPTLSATDREDCAAWLEHHRLAGSPLVLIQPGNKRTMRGRNRQRSSNLMYWPESHWGEVIAGVRQLLPASRVILCGSPAERSLAEDIVAQVPGSREGIVIAAGELPIPRLLALQERAHSMISVNTGPAHSAAAMGCPVVALFTRHVHRAAVLYAPQTTSAPVKLILPEETNTDAGLDSIAPTTVIAAWLGMTAALRGKGA